MVRMFLIFLITSGIIYGGIEGFRALTGKQKWALTKSLGYSMLVSVLTVIFLTTIVILF